MINKKRVFEFKFEIQLKFHKSKLSDAPLLQRAKNLELYKIICVIMHECGF